MFTFVNKYFGRAAAAVFLACMAVIYVLTLKNDLLAEKNKSITLERNQFQQHGVALYQANEHHLAVIKRNKKLNAKLMRKIENGQQQLTHYTAQINTLEASNAQLKAWSDTDLPRDIVRLQQHPAFNRTEDYEQWLSKRFTLQPASIEPPDQ